MSDVFTPLKRALGILSFMGFATLLTAAHAQAPGAPMMNPAKAPVNKTVILKVNGQAVTQGEVDEMVNQMAAQQMQQMMMMNGGQMPTTGTQITDDMKIKARERLIGSVLLEQAVAKNVKNVPDKAVDAEIDKINKDLAKEGSDLKKKLAESGNRMTIDVIRTKIRERLATIAVTEKEVGSVEPKEDEMKKFFEEHKADMGEPEEYRASHVLIKFNEKNPRDPNNKPSAEDKAKAKKKAEDVLKRVKNGEDFAKVAKETSDDGSKEKGGDLGFFPKDQMVPEFSAAVVKLKDGEVTSDVVESPFGYHIIKRTGHKDAKAATYEGIKTQLHEYLRMDNMKKKLPLAVAKLQAQAKIEEVKGAATKTDAPKADAPKADATKKAEKK